MNKPTSEQKQAIETIDKNVIVSAGAGSGKTRVLVERFLYILEQWHTNKKEKEKLSVNNILAITFTRKAAMEMKDRVRKGIRKRLANETDTCGFWREQLELLESAQITTIHGLCSHILRENSVEAGLDPAFNVAEEVETQEFLEAVLKDFVRSMLKKHDKSVNILVEVYGAKGLLRQMRDLLPKIEDITQHDLAQPYENSLNNSSGIKEHLCVLIKELAGRRYEVSAKSKQYEKLEELAENLQDILEGIEEEPVNFDAYDKYVKPLRRDGALKDLIGEVKDARSQVDFREADKKALGIVKAWQNTIRDFSEYIEQRKRAVDFISFDDLESLALKLLQENAEVCRKYMRRYYYIMVDEFQDTNNKQKQLIYLLCGGSAEHLRGRKLFIVGDPKQSIYRFRGADVSVFDKVQQDIINTNGENITLVYNFRTVDTILRACNEAFSRLLSENESSGVHFKLDHKDQRESKEKPIFLQIPFDDTTQPFKRELEAKAVAREVAKMHSRGINCREITILLRKMTNCNLIADALREENIPYQVIDGKGFYERQEIIDLLNMLTVLQNRHRSLELAGILRSCYFGINDAVLTKLFLKGHEEGKSLWDVIQKSDITLFGNRQQELLQRAVKILNRLRQNAMLLPLPSLWEEIFAELNVEAVLSLQEDGNIKLVNVKKLVQLANKYSTEKQGTLGSWLEYTDKIRKADVRETSANLNADDAVTIMTIHKSKGLEFKNVFLPMLDDSSSSDNGEIKFDSEIGLGIKVLMDGGNFAKTSVLEQVREADTKHQNAERQRQLYVAMTRAQDRLVLSGVFKKDGKSKADSWFNNLRKIFENSKLVGNESENSQNGENTINGKTEIRNSCPANLEMIDALPQYYSSGKREFTASRLQTYLHCQREYFYRYVAGLPEFEETEASKGTTLPAYVIGLIVHKALECYDRDLNEAWKRAVNEYAEGRSPDKYFEVLKKYVSSDLFKKLTGEKLKEIRFTYKADNDFIIKGVIDCLITEDNGLRIIDYKTGRAPAEDENIDGYYMQLALYKKAVEKIYGKKVISAELHFLQDLSVKELPEAGEWAEKALNLCSELSRKGEEKDFECNFGSCGHCMYSYLCPKK